MNQRTFAKWLTLQMGQGLQNISPSHGAAKKEMAVRGGESMGKGEGHTKAKLRTTERTEVTVVFGYTPQNRNNE